MKHKHIIIIGRASEAENEVAHYRNTTEKDAVSKFKKHIMDVYEFREGERDIYLEAVIASDSHQKVLQYQQ
jgi:hypothetical protein